MVVSSVAWRTLTRQIFSAPATRNFRVPSVSQLQVNPRTAIHTTLPVPLENFLPALADVF